MIALQNRLARLADLSDVRTRRLIDDVDLDALPPRAAALWASITVAAWTLADTEVARNLSQLAGRPFAPVGAVPNPDQAELAATARAIIDEPVTYATEAAVAASIADRLAQFSRTHTLDSGKNGTLFASRKQGVTGWVRLTDADPCPLCQRWDDGIVRPTTASMATHQDCGCIPQPVLD